jgi:pSer/pThr/pTyr-binding forkhead associated (FHA) protein
MLGKYSVDAFMEACGAGDSLLLDIQRDGVEEGRRLALNQPFAVIGRAANADLSLTDAGLARRHAYLQVIAGQVCCLGFGDPSSLHWGERGSASGWLLVRQAVRLGPYRIRLLRAGAQDLPPDLGQVNPLAAGSAAQLGMPALTLGFLHDDVVRLRWHMDRLLVLVGSAPDCRVRIAAADGSRFHCALVSTPQGTWLVDLLGRGGTFLNGVQVRQSRLDDGDVVRIAQLSIRVEYEGGDPTARSRRTDLQTGLVPVGAPGALPLSGSAPLPPLWGAAFPATPEALAALPAEGWGQALLSLGGSPDAALGSVLLPLVNQFNLMQHQMLDQFQQALVQMFQMFSGLHKDQMGYLREEMERQQQITQELRALQVELTKLHAAAPGRGQPERPASPVGGNGAAPSSEPAGARRGGAGGPTPSSAQAAPAPGEPGGAPAPNPNAPEGVPAGAAGPNLGGQDVHAWLCQRMAALQQERQSRWRRILNFLAGKPSEGEIP